MKTCDSIRMLSERRVCFREKEFRFFLFYCRTSPALTPFCHCFWPPVHIVSTKKHLWFSPEPAVKEPSGGQLVQPMPPIREAPFSISYFHLMRPHLRVRAVMKRMSTLWRCLNSHLLDVGQLLTCNGCSFLWNLKLEPVFLLGSEEPAAPPGVGSL